MAYWDKRKQYTKIESLDIVVSSRSWHTMLKQYTKIERTVTPADPVSVTVQRNNIQKLKGIVLVWTPRFLSSSIMKQYTKIESDCPGDDRYDEDDETIYKN